MRAGRDTLDVFTSADAHSDVRVVSTWSYQALRPETARLFRLLSLHRGPDISLAAAASVAGLPTRRARKSLAELARSHLLVEHFPGRFVWHDLIRAHAATLAGEVDSTDEHATALARLISHYEHTACSARGHLAPELTTMPPPPLCDGVTVETIPDREAAIRTLTTISSAVAVRVRASGGKSGAAG